MLCAGLQTPHNFIRATPSGDLRRTEATNGERMDVVTQWEEVPAFKCEHDEAQFWMTHALDPKLMAESIVGADQSESTLITMRMDPRMLARIKRLARSRYLNYQSMIKQWLSERLEAELRERERK
jgi:predicted DNA binding CopG/RHH family protein